MEKRIDYNENIILLSSEPLTSCNGILVSEIRFNDEQLKRLNFSARYDIVFDVYCDKGITDDVVFEYDSNHPLYNYIKKLLNRDEELVIEDDLTRESGSKYICIKKTDDKYTIKFVDKKIQEQPSCEISVFIKNIYPDPRSKIDDSIKLRIMSFFKDVEKSLLKENSSVFSDDIIDDSIKKQDKTKILSDNKK